MLLINCNKTEAYSGGSSNLLSNTVLLTQKYNESMKILAAVCTLDGIDGQLTLKSEYIFISNRAVRKTRNELAAAIAYRSEIYHPYTIEGTLTFWLYVRD